ncbi:hypothetical protein PIB30_046912 [Stylosanthes scabra]|uniref:Uncharacterized protein n=1 Tax=Stylosanthes scabra TaxID=79078 RepID=A0ABU6WGL7_9FABA|nr:hypothetical protein [Stylosanthes scabra]
MGRGRRFRRRYCLSSLSLSLSLSLASRVEVEGESDPLDINDPLDFELEDRLLKPPPKVSNKRRKKVIGVDDLLTDRLREQQKLKEEQDEQEKPKRKKVKKEATSHDDDEDPREALLTKLVQKCENQLKDFGEEEDIPLWGVKVFGEKKAFPTPKFPGLGSCNLLQSFLNNELNYVVELSAEKGDNFLEGLLINGWLLKLAFLCDHIEKPVAIWSVDTMLYSSKEELRNSSSDFWLINCLSKLVGFPSTQV